MSITVYSKPMCVQCDATMRALNKQDLDYDVVDMTVDAEALEYVKSLGYVQAPVVMAGDQHWSGYRPDLIKKLAKEAAIVVNG
ncbi:MAG TPA: glutaredoxin-like protein NrdH [Actinomyces sp.]|jgi:glutaredoxin-like protein NrdH|nr:glutaredoxin-like protein NrdH [Acidobacteriota bacterium]HHT41352.1 glutaredoxin-like protein NrdH [Actinomyces sp.]